MHVSEDCVSPIGHSELQAFVVSPRALHESQHELADALAAWPNWRTKTKTPTQSASRHQPRFPTSFPPDYFNRNEPELGDCKRL